MRTDTDDTVLVKVACSILAHIRNVGSKLLHTALGVTHLSEVLLHVDGSKYIPADHPLRKHDSILVVVTLPRHERHFEVTSECKFAILGGIALCEDLSLLHLIALAYNRLEENGRALVGPAVDRKLIYGDIVSETYKSLVISPVILDMDFICIHIDHFTRSLGHNLGP